MEKHKEEKGLKFDQEKPNMSLLSFSALEEISKVLTFGSKKYGKNNWQLVENGTERYESAMLRHITAIHQGEEFDQESGMSHWGHAGCCMIFLIHIYLAEKEKIKAEENK